MDTSVFEALLIKRRNPLLNIQLSKPGYTHQLRIFNWRHQAESWFLLEMNLINNVILSYVVFLDRIIYLT